VAFGPRKSCGPSSLHRRRIHVAVARRRPSVGRKAQMGPQFRKTSHLSYASPWCDNSPLRHTLPSGLFPKCEPLKERATRWAMSWKQSCQRGNEVGTPPPPLSGLAPRVGRGERTPRASPAQKQAGGRCSLSISRRIGRRPSFCKRTQAPMFSRFRFLPSVGHQQRKKEQRKKDQSPVQGRGASGLWACRRRVAVLDRLPSSRSRSYMRRQS